jgi:hypothetical protein
MAVAAMQSVPQVALAVGDGPAADPRLFGSLLDSHLGRDTSGWLIKETKFTKVGRSKLRATTNGRPMVTENQVLSQ